MEAPVRQHSSILTLALTFFGGLVLMPVIVMPFVPQFAAASTEYGDLLRNMQILSGVLTLFYVLLRRSEGDFRALFIVTLFLFAGSESSGDIARRFGVASLRPLEMLFTFSLFIYGALALAAAIAEERRGDWFHHALVTAVVGFVFLSATRIYFERKGAAWDERGRFFTLIILALLGVQIVVVLICAEVRARRAELTAKAQRREEQQE
jgi:hypothetical protein